VTRPDSNKAIKLDDWKRGDPLTAEHFQQSHDAIKSLTGGIGLPRQVPADFVIKNEPQEAQPVGLNIVQILQLGQIDTLAVQRVTRVGPGLFTGTGNAFTAFTFPPATASSFEFLLGGYSPAYFIGDAWYVTQSLVFHTHAAVDTPLRSCTPA